MNKQQATEYRFAKFYLDRLEECERHYMQGGELASKAVKQYDHDQRMIRHSFVTAEQNTKHDRQWNALIAQFPNRGRNLMVLRQPVNERIEWLTLALHSAQALNQDDLVGYILANLGTDHHRLADYWQAIEYANQAYAVANRLNIKELQASALSTLGAAYLELGQTDKARIFQEQSLALVREQKDTFEESGRLSNLGNIAEEKGQYQEAIDYYQQALTISQQRGNQPQICIDLANLGNVHWRMKQHRKAADYLQQALVIAQQIDNKDFIATILLNQANVFGDTGEKVEAIANLEQALKIVREKGDNRRSEGEILYNLGVSYYKTKRRNEAQQALVQARDIFQSLNLTALVKEAEHALGVAKRGLNRFLP